MKELKGKSIYKKKLRFNRVLNIRLRNIEITFQNNYNKNSPSHNSMKNHQNLNYLKNKNSYLKKITNTFYPINKN